MNTKRMIINRVTDWYNVIDVQSDPFYLSIIILERLSTRQKKGVKYDRLEISSLIAKQRNATIVEMIDKAVVILVSRQLIRINEGTNRAKTLMITESGMEALNKYREVLAKNEN